MRVIAGFLRGKKLQAAPAEITRPTSDRAKESLFNILNHLLIVQQKGWADIVFCDVFAGSGAIGLEAVSRGTKNVFFFENNPIALKYLQQNIKGTTGYMMTGNACLPPKAMQKADVVFMDPPYGDGLWEKALVAFKTAGWIQETTLIVIESDKSNQEIIPPSFVLQQERFYGRNKFLFLTIQK